MRFLCLHGMGTNSKIFEMQTAAIRYGLGADHTYEYIDGAYLADKAPGLESFTTEDSETLQYSLDATVDQGVSARKSMLDLEQVVATEGPFDGIMAFSSGAGLAASFLVHAQRTMEPVPFRVAIFYSGGVPADPVNMHENEARFRFLDPDTDGELINIPTAHIWGAHDTLYPTFGPVLKNLCSASNRSEFVHQGSHEIPGGKDPLGVQKSVLTIKRALARAES